MSAAGCSSGAGGQAGDNGSSGGVTTSTAAPELRPAGEVLAERVIDGALPFGESASVGQHTVTVSSAETAPDSGGFRLAVQLRVENSSGEEHFPPEVSIVCSGNADRGGSQADSTMKGTDRLPPGTFIEATQYLLLPGDSRITGQPVPACAEPAVIVVEWCCSWSGDRPGASWQIPAGVIPAATS